MMSVSSRRCGFGGHPASRFVERVDKASVKLGSKD